MRRKETCLFRVGVIDRFPNERKDAIPSLCDVAMAHDRDMIDNLDGTISKRQRAR